MMKLSEAGQRVFDARYAMRDDQGNIIETFDQAVERLARQGKIKARQGWIWGAEFVN